MRLILASGSQRRRELMGLCGYEYEVVVSQANEDIDETDPELYVKSLALRKAEEVYMRLRGEYASATNEVRPDANLAIVGSDTVVAFDGQIIGKPRDKEDAVRILTLLSGKTHRVYTGVSVITEDSCQVECSVTEVTFATLSDCEIQSYVASGEPMDKAGAYGIQGPFGMFVDSVRGNYFTIIGMPLPTLYRMLKNVGIVPHGFTLK